MKRIGKRALLSSGLVAGISALMLSMGATSAQADHVDDAIDGDDVGTNIINGQPAEEDQYPWMVALADSSNPSFNFCGGSLVDDDVVLTAAHCIENDSPGDLVVHHGSIDLDSSDLNTYEVEEIHVASDYNSPVSLANDWGLLKLTEPVADGEAIEMAATDEHNDNDLEVSGWGVDENGSSPSILHWVEVPYVDDEQCEVAFGSDLHADSMLCAGFWEEGGYDACQGDSGGPLMAVDDGQAVQVGVVSWGIGCAEPELPGVYAQVDHFSADAWDVIDSW